MTAQAAPRLSLRGLSKSFGGIRALRDVDFDIHAGEIHALLGENGAGKSTLVKIVTGLEPADAGEILLDGRTVAFRTPTEARSAGVVAVYQDPKLFPHLGAARGRADVEVPTIGPRTIDDTFTTNLNAMLLFTKGHDDFDTVLPMEM